MSQYIPDLTERFPEGFGGVDMTSKYFPSRGNIYDMWDVMSESDLIGYDDMPPTTETKPRVFKVG